MVVLNEKRRIQLEALKALIRNDYNGIFILPTGTGKSWVLIDALRRLIKKHNYEKVWYLCNSTDLRDVDFKKELELWNAKDLIPRIEFMCYKTAYKRAGEEVDVLLADEMDFSLSPEYSKVYFNNTFKHKILTTAFIDKKKLPLAKKISEIVYDKGLQEVEDKKVLNRSQYFFVHFLMNKEEVEQYVKYNEKMLNLSIKLGQLKSEWHYVSAFDKPNIENQIRNVNDRIEIVSRARKRFLNSLDSSKETCRKLMREIYNENKQCKILTFCELTKQADKVCRYSYHGDSSSNQNLEKFRNDEIQALSVCGKINRGVNIKGIDHIIFESSNSSKTQMTQRLGRGKRLEVDKFLKVYFLIPCYYENGKVKFTKVRSWVLNAAGNLDLSKAKTYRFKS